MRSEPQGRAYTGLPSHGKPLSSAAHTPLFTLLSDKRDRRRTEMQPVFPQHEASMMEDFIERTLRERRSLPDALGVFWQSTIASRPAPNGVCWSE